LFVRGVIQFNKVLQGFDLANVDLRDGITFRIGEFWRARIFLREL
jgi:hypothetical protein